MIVDIEPGRVVRLDGKRTTSSAGGAYDISELAESDRKRVLRSLGVSLIEDRHPGPDLVDPPTTQEPAKPAVEIVFAHKKAKELFEAEHLDGELLAASGVQPSSELGLTTGDVRDVLAYRDQQMREEP